MSFGGGAPRCIPSHAARAAARAPPFLPYFPFLPPRRAAARRPRRDLGGRRGGGGGGGGGVGVGGVAERGLPCDEQLEHAALRLGVELEQSPLQIVLASPGAPPPPAVAPVTSTLAAALTFRSAELALGRLALGRRAPQLRLELRTSCTS